MMTKMAGLFGAMPQAPDTLERGPDWNLYRIALSKSTAGKCAPMQAVKQLVKLENFDDWETLKIFMVNYGLLYL